MSIEKIGNTEKWNHLELSVVVPLYNEEAVVGELHRRLDLALRGLGVAYEIVFVNDGSKDATAELTAQLVARDPCLRVIHLSRNFGHQAAVCAGIDQARGAAVLVMDGDLQDPPELIPEFYALWKRGWEVVYAVRGSRKERGLKRLGYYLFYRIMAALSDLEIPLDSGDFGLMDRRVVEELKKLPEKKRFVRGLRTFVGFRQVGLEYARSAREAGEPKYTFRGLVRLALDGLVSFSDAPLRLASILGGVAILMALGLGAFTIIDAIWTRTAPPGWASLMTTVLFLGAVQLICVGILGEYLRLIFYETKGRPTYIVGRIDQHAAAELSDGSATPPALTASRGDSAP